VGQKKFWRVKISADQKHFKNGNMTPETLSDYLEYPFSTLLAKIGLCFQKKL
jgi:hypothetical protein